MAQLARIAAADAMGPLGGAYGSRLSFQNRHHWTLRLFDGAGLYALLQFVMEAALVGGLNRPKLPLRTGEKTKCLTIAGVEYADEETKHAGASRTNYLAAFPGSIAQALISIGAIHCVTWLRKRPQPPR
jgi:hypothetical protein